ncbi:phosphopantetheine-binding protein [Embleya sp. MST-111070]|uniref:phosphopantetheine-binding protein n=1 Tax=Embleya sp. MST-111070 TaxID=3398231 RepID=UPI003F73AC68
MPDGSVREIVDVVVELLAEQQGRSVDELYEELSSQGAELPVDSVLIVEILTRVENRFGVTISADAEAGRSLRSVWAFAETVHEAVPAKEGLS